MDKNIFFITITIFMLFYRQAESGGPIATFIQTNIIGFPLLHETQKWVFDPDIALKRRKDFVQENGDKGNKLIQQLGSGSNDRREERLKRQQVRDNVNTGGSTWLPEE